MVGSRYLIFYLHASGEDIRLSYKMLDYLRNLYQVRLSQLRSTYSPCSTAVIAFTRAVPPATSSRKTASTLTTIWSTGWASSSRT